MEKLSFVIPAYNEGKTIASVVTQLTNKFPEAEILVVNDGSDDNTKEESIKAGALVYSHPHCMGNGASVKDGIRYCSGEIIVLMDADGQHKPEDAEMLLQCIKTYNMVVGARTSSSKTVWYRDIANTVYNRLASYMTDFKIEDLTSGFRVFRKSEVSQFLYLFPNGFSYPTTVTMAYLRSGRSVHYVPIETEFRVGKSKIKLVKDGSKFFLVIMRIATLYSPLKIFIPTSLMFFALGMFWYLFSYFICNAGFPKMSLLLFMTSVIVFMQGLLSEQICQMRYDKTG
ncbi:glycosyl transferase [candidate division KSB1 bacterium 4484_219]|nr:MAG: glycosyl transferase [candidate division KSB1 bacterium 4484_219]